jgi:hypothetical protein
VEARLVAVLFDVIAPALLPGLPVEGVEGAGARADEYEVPGDRRGGPDSTARIVLPQNPRISRLSEARRETDDHGNSQEKYPMGLHFASYLSPNISSITRSYFFSSPDSNPTWV